MRCFIGFYGLTRSVRYTADSIHKCIYTPLRQAGLDLTAVGHFNLPTSIMNPRSGEIGLPTNRREGALLDLEICWVEEQDDEKIRLELEVGKAFPDRFADDYRSLGNLCHQLRSLRQLWSLMQLLGVADGDLVLLLRPDLVYLDPICPEMHFRPLLARQADLIVPEWQNWGGLNDRLALCTARGAEVYATRFSQFVDGCAALGGIHSETFLKFVVHSAGLSVSHTALRAVRVRADGSIAANDLALMDTTVAQNHAGRMLAAQPYRVAHTRNSSDRMPVGVTPGS